MIRPCYTKQIRRRSSAVKRLRRICFGRFWCVGRFSGQQFWTVERLVRGLVMLFGSCGVVRRGVRPSDGWGTKPA